MLGPARWQESSLLLLCNTVFVTLLLSFNDSQCTHLGL